MFKYARLLTQATADIFEGHLVSKGCTVTSRGTDDGVVELVYTKPAFDPAVDRDLGPTSDDTADLLDLQHEDQERHGWEQA